MKTKSITNEASIILILLMIGLFGNIKLFSQSQGPNNPGIVIDQNAACLSCPGADWQNPMNAAVSDNMFAIAQLTPHANCFQSACHYTRALVASHFNFSIPSNATITGITVDIQKRGNAALSIVDTAVFLMANNLSVGINHSLSGFWTTTNSTYSYGSNSDLWGYAWTPALIDSSSFGVFFKAENRSSIQQSASVDHIGVTVYYSIPTSVTELNFSDDNTINAQFDAYQQSIILSGTLSETANYSFSIYDITGKLVFNNQNVNLPKGEFRQSFQTNSLKSGLYFISVNSGDKKIVKKFIVSDK